MASHGFVHLHIHSCYSLGEGVITPERLVQCGAELGMGALALTDRNTLAGVPRFVRAAKKHGVKPIVGCEVDFCATHRRTADRGKHYSLVLLVESEEGYRNLSRLVTLAWRRAQTHSAPAATLDELSEHSKGLIVLTSGSRGELFDLLGGEDVDATEAYLGKLLSIAGERLFIEMVLCREGRNALVNAKIHVLSRLTKIRALATQDVYYASPEDELCARFLKGERFDAQILCGEDKGKHPKSGYFVGRRDLLREYPHYSDEIEASEEVASRCNFALWDERTYFPHRDFSRGQDAESVLWDIVSERVSASDLEPRAETTGIEAEIKERLNKEFDAMKKERFADVLIFLADTARFLSEQRIPYSVGGESLGASLIAHLLGIVEIDPLKYGLAFESFRGNGSDEPLFSIRVAPRHIASIVHYWRELCGEESVAEIGEPDYCSRAELKAAVEKWLGDFCAQEEMAAGGSARLAAIAEVMIRTLEQCPRAIRTRGDRYVVSGTSLLDVCPIIKNNGAAMVTQYAADDLVAFGLRAVEVVPDAMLALVDECLRIAHERTQSGAGLSANKVIADSSLYQALAKGETKGVPCFETPGVLALLRQRKPKQILQLVNVLRDADQEAGDKGQSARKTGGKEQGDVSCMQLVINALRVLKMRITNSAAFFAATLGRLRRGSRLFGVLSAEIRHSRINILPVDINFSLFNFSLEEHGLRAGLRIVRGVTESVYREIERTRISGAFNDVDDFSSRVDRRMLTPTVVRNLIKAGAFDSVSADRQDLLRRYEMRCSHGIRERSGDKGLQRRDDVPSIRAHIMLEREATGCLLSVDLMALFRDALKRMKIAHGKKALLKPREGLQWIAGFVGAIDKDTRFTNDEIRLLAEVSGVLVMVPKEVWRKDARRILGSRPVIVGGRVNVIDGEAFLIAAGFWDLEEAEREAHRVEKVVFDLHGKSSECVKRLRRAAQEYPGGTPLEVRDYEEEAVHQVERLEERKVFWCLPLIEEIKALLPTEAVTVVKRVA
jgi:DNA polymerase III alpha subunit